MFALRTKMVKTIKMNLKNDTKARWTVGNVMTVPVLTARSTSYGAQLALSTFRINKNLENDKDLTRYFQQFRASRQIWSWKNIAPAHLIFLCDSALTSSNLFVRLLC